MDLENTFFHTEKRVRVLGIDDRNWDRPSPFLANEFKETLDPKVIMKAHFAGIEIGYYHSISPTGLKFVVLQLKLKKPVPFEYTQLESLMRINTIAAFKQMYMLKLCIQHLGGTKILKLKLCNRY